MSHREYDFIISSYSKDFYSVVSSQTETIADSYIREPSKHKNINFRNQNISLVFILHEWRKFVKNCLPAISEECALKRFSFCVNFTYLTFIQNVDLRYFLRVKSFAIVDFSSLSFIHHNFHITKEKRKNVEKEIGEIVKT